MKKTVIAVIALIVSAGLLCACAEKPAEPEAEPPTAPSTPDAAVAGEELLCLCGSPEEAEKTAELYGITLVDFSYGVAVFHAEGDLDALIRTGMENGWPELNYNTTASKPH